MFPVEESTWTEPGMNDPVKQIKIKINHYNYIQVIKFSS